MDIQSISKQSLAISQLVKAQVGTGRIALPVNSNSVYANFKHITGVGTSGNQPAYSFNQLRNLDNLIDRLKLLKGDGKALNLQGADKNDVAEMIETYRRELYHQLSNNNPYYRNISARGVSLDLFI